MITVDELIEKALKLKSEGYGSAVLMLKELPDDTLIDLKPVKDVTMYGSFTCCLSL
jgi:hypothetical protein